MRTLKERELRDSVHVASNSRGNNARTAAWCRRRAIASVGGKAWSLELEAVDGKLGIPCGAAAFPHSSHSSLKWLKLSERSRYSSLHNSSSPTNFWNF